MPFKFSGAVHDAARVHYKVRAPCWVFCAQDGRHQAVALHPDQDVGDGAGLAW